MKKLKSKMWVCGAALLGMGLPAACAQNGSQPASYYEFGKVVALGKHAVEVRTFDARVGRSLQRTFTLTRETRADVVHVGDSVEVIYAPGAADGGWTLSRLLVLRDGTPQPGPAFNPAREASARPASGAAGPSSSNGRSAAPMLAVPGRRSTALGRSTPPPGAAPGTAAAGAQPLALGTTSVSKVPGVIAVPLGVGKEAANPYAPRVKGIAHDNPEAECRQSVADWGAQPITLAVLDFRYPTEREESHDVGSTGGGSGTAVADLVFNRLGEDVQFQLSRGDRQKLYRMDFAGAARLGRQLGVDAVLLGTFSPVALPVVDPDFPPPTQAYTLRAGVVDTCTGQLLFRLSSVSCAAPVPGAEADPATCPGSRVTVKQAADPVTYGEAFKSPIDALLAPLEGRADPVQGALGTVLAAQGATVTLRVAAGAALHAGDQVSVHATRLAKNPTTYTLHRYVDEEIGRLTLDRVGGGTATGRFVGDVPPRAGDAVERVPE